MKANEKTNVMRTLEQKKIVYTGHFYDADSSLTGTEIAEKLGEPTECVFKTLVTSGKPGKYYVFVIPVDEELDLKKCARSVGAKSVHLIPMKELFPLTGYVRGGCTAIGMKKQFPTRLEESAILFDRIYVSGGRIGSQIRLAPDDFLRAAEAEYAELT